MIELGVPRRRGHQDHEPVDRDEAIDAFVPVLDEMLAAGGLITLEKVHIVRYRARAEP